MPGAAGFSLAVSVASLDARCSAPRQGPAAAHPSAMCVVGGDGAGNVSMAWPMSRMSAYAVGASTPLVRTTMTRGPKDVSRLIDRKCPQMAAPARLLRVAKGSAIAYIYGIMSDDERDPWMRLSEAAAACGVSATTLRRLCDHHVLPATRMGRNWMVRASDVRHYVLARPAAGAPRASIRLKGPATRYRGHAPNPRLRDAEGFQFGWRFQAAVDANREVPFSIWLSDELLQRLRDEGHDSRHLVIRAAENLAQQVILERETLPRGHDILLNSTDRVRLLRAAGLGPDHFSPSEAPLERGALVIYEFTARDTVWVGDQVRLDTDRERWIDAVVGWTYVDGRRRVRAIRLREPAPPTRRADVVRTAIAAYRRRCRLLRQRPGEWLAGVEAQLPPPGARARK